MEINRELLLSVRTSMEAKGPYKLQITKNDYVVSNIKIRMRDDVTHIIQLSQGEYILKVLKGDKEHLVNSFSLPNFENGSQIKANITDTEIQLNFDGIIKYKTVDEYMDIINSDETKKKEKKAKKAQEKQQVNYVSLNKNKVQAKPKPASPVSHSQTQSHTTKNNNKKNILIENNNTSSDVQINIAGNDFKFSDFVSREEFNSKIEELTREFNLKIASLQREVEELKSNQSSQNNQVRKEAGIEPEVLNN